MDRIFTVARILQYSTSFGWKWGNPADFTKTINQTLPLNWTPGMLEVSIPYERGGQKRN